MGGKMPRIKEQPKEEKKSKDSKILSGKIFSWH